MNSAEPKQLLRPQHRGRIEVGRKGQRHAAGVIVLGVLGLPILEREAALLCVPARQDVAVAREGRPCARIITAVLTAADGSVIAAIECRAETVGRTGVEMEAMTGASIAALTLYDMAKGLSHEIVIESVRLLEKTGGKHVFGSAEARP